MKRLIFTSILTAAAGASFAQVSPKVKPEQLVSGEKYVLVNKAQTVNQYTSRTSWDGALYFLGKEDSKYADYALTAQDNADGTWSFTLMGEDSTDYYMVLPDGGANVNVNATHRAKWILDPKADNFYQLIVGDGNNSTAIFVANSSETHTPTGDVRMHLNGGGQYFVTTYYGGPWYPDCLGGIKSEFNEETCVETFEANDSLSFNWGFVKLENIPAYYEDMQYVSVINNFHSNYCNIEGYEAGFMCTFNKMSELYLAAEDPKEVGLSDYADAKIALYREIENAIKINEKEDATLAAAVAAAKKSFDEQSEVAAVSSATETLKQAELAYAKGTGDVTSMGRNMSFEDLSAQGGAETSGVAGAPAGWNVYINGTQVTTADEVKAAGIANWHGANSDCDGDIKDGNVGFGIWTSNVPEYEISQTIEGLEIGTYEITAGLMAGANGNGSRLTTQRIFGNLNSCYYGCESDYEKDQLSNLENYSFANNDNIQTDRDMMPVSVKAFVYDGVLTFGLRTNGNFAANNRSQGNSAGGDGWFKVDNFKIKSLGYQAEDAIALYDSYANVLVDYKNYSVPMAAGVMQTLKKGLESYKEFNKDSKAEDIVAGIKWAMALQAEVEKSVQAYKRLNEAIDRHEGMLDEYDDKPGVDVYSDFIYEVKEGYEDGAYADDAAVDSIIGKLDAALDACIKSDVIAEGDDITFYINNPSFEDLSAQGGGESSGVANAPAGWNLYINGEQCSTVSEINNAGVNGWCAINGGDNINVTLEDGTTVTNQYSDGTHLWGIWNGNIPEVELSQTICGLPAGTYALSCDVLIQYNWAGDCLTTQRIFANEYTAMYSSEENYGENLPADALNSARIDSLNPTAEVKHLTYAGYQCEAPRSDYSHTVALTFGLAEKGDVKIGFRTNNIGYDGTPLDSGKGWFKLDNFRLTYVSEEVPEAAEATPVTEITASVAAPEYYSISGMRLAAPQKGVNIVKENGKVKKVWY